MLSNRLEQALFSFTFPYYLGIVNNILPYTKQPPNKHPDFFLYMFLQSESIKVSYLMAAERMGTAQHSVPAGTLHR